jgi:prepilin-type N-terminal cleavage/methylation domain-containing protein
MKSGFALVELLVVIAILGILSATAVGTYKQYSAKAKIATIYKTIEKLDNDSMAYFNKKGSMPIVADIGYAAEPATPVYMTYAQSKALSPYAIRFVINPLNCVTDNPLLNVEIIAVDVDTALLGVSGNIRFLHIIAESNGIIKKWCSYHDNTSLMTPENIQYLPQNCQNLRNQSLICSGG